MEKHIVGEQYARDIILNSDSPDHTGRQEGLLTALAEIDDRVQRIAILEDNADASRLIRRILQAQGEFLIDEACQWPGWFKIDSTNPAQFGAVRLDDARLRWLWRSQGDEKRSPFARYSHHCHHR
ncbi:MAG: hypothetical protein M5U34_00775 [Chloroflexi bacterium]|nr:hypothetical protein [Chloroflexota bacterium]